MKKLLATLIALTMLVSAVVCGAVAETADITGEWYGSVFGMSMTLTLHEDGTYTMSMIGEEAEPGTWSFDGTTLTLDEGSEGESSFAYDGESLSASMEGMDFVFTREPIATFEPAPARTDAALEEFSGSWNATTIGIMGMYLSPDVIGAGISLDIDGTTVVMTIIQEDSEPEAVTVEATFADGVLTVADPTSTEESSTFWTLSLLEDGTMSMFTQMEGIEMTYYLSPAEAAQ